MKTQIEHRTQRRSSAEKNLADKTLARAATKKADPAKFTRAARLTKAAIKSPRFEYNRLFSVIDQLPIHYFHLVGESVTGILGEPGEEMWRGSTYPMVLDAINGRAIDGQRVIRLPGNRMLHKLIQAADCIGQRITVTYRGKLYYRYGGHYQKVYELEAAPLSDAMMRKGRELLGRIAADAGVKAKRKGDDEPRRLFAKPDTPIVLDKTKAMQVLEDAAAKGNKTAREILERKKRGRK